MRLTLTAVLMAAIAPAAVAADPPAYPFEIRVAGAGRPMILIPGLGCKADVWDSTVARYKDRYECHAVTLAGFAGVPPLAADTPFVPAAVDGLVRYVRDKKLDRPVLVGHSLGAFLALRTAAAAPDRVGPVVAVDGFPNGFELMMPEATAEDRERFIGGFLTSLTSGSKADGLAVLRQMFGEWLEGDRLEAVMGWLAASDRGTIAKAMREYFATDGREGLEKLTSPVLLAAGYHPAAIGKFVPGVDVFTRRCELQVAEVKGAKVAVHPNCKHFVMYDESKWLFEQMDAFLGAK